MIKEERKWVPASKRQEQAQTGKKEPAQNSQRPATYRRPPSGRLPQTTDHRDQGQQQPYRAHIGDKLGVTERGKDNTQIAQAVRREQRPVEQQRPQAEAGHIHVAETAAPQSQLAQFQRGQQLGGGDQDAQQDPQDINEEGGGEVTNVRIRARACCQQPCTHTEKIDIGRLCVTGQQSERHKQSERQEQARVPNQLLGNCWGTAGVPLVVFHA